MRKYEDIEAELFELYDLESELNYLNEKVDDLEAELAELDIEAGEDE